MQDDEPYFIADGTDGWAHGSTPNCARDSSRSARGHPRQVSANGSSSAGGKVSSQQESTLCAVM